MTWSVSEAKAKLSSLLARARRGPQIIESRGEEVAVVLSVAEYQRLLEAQARPRATPMQTWLASVERLRGGADLELQLPPRTPADARPVPPLGQD